MGLYTSDEIMDGDFKDYSMEDVQEQVHKEIANNANAVEFPDTEVVADTQAVEIEGQQAVPDFMQG